MKDKEYIIEVIMLPHDWDNEEEPYFWCIKCWNEKDKVWYSYSNGWAKSPSEAWDMANEKYRQI